MDAEPEGGDTRGQEAAVHVGVNPQNSRRDFRVVAEESVLVTDLDHQEDIRVFPLEFHHLLFQRGVFDGGAVLGLGWRRFFWEVVGGF